MAAPASGAQLGINGGPLLYNGYHGWIAQNDVDRVLSDLRAAGITRVRMDAAEGDRAFVSYVATELSAHGMRWDVTLAGILWALPSVSFARELAQAYHPAQIEVGNEPDYVFQQQGYPTAPQYAQRYAAVRRAIATVAPELPVVPGAMCCSLPYMRAFLRALPQHHLRWYLDHGLAVHTYWVPAWRWERLLNEQGLRHKRLVVNEFGWSTDPTPWGPSLQTADEWTREFNYRWAISHWLADRRVRLIEPYVWGSDIVSAYESLIPTLEGSVP